MQVYSLNSIQSSSAFKGVTFLPEAKKSIQKNINVFYGGDKSLEKMYDKLADVRINASEYLKINNKELENMNIILHNVHYDKDWKDITYLYSIPNTIPGLFTLTTKTSILKNPIELFKQVMIKQNPAIQYKYNNNISKI